MRHTALIIGWGRLGFENFPRFHFHLLCDDHEIDDEYRQLNYLTQIVASFPELGPLTFFLSSTRDTIA